MKDLNDKELYELCKKYGAAAVLWRRKFIGLLPEVNKRRLFETKGFSSIFEFAAKLCGLSQEQVRLALNLEKRFEDKPILKGMLESGEVSINKLVRVVSIATPENEEELAEKIRILPKSALATWVRDVRATTKADGLNKPQIVSKSMPGHTLDFQIADDVAKELNDLNSKDIDINELLRKMLKQRREEIEEAKEIAGLTVQKTESHYIPVDIRNILHEEYGDKCSINTCNKPSTQIHHSQRFSLSHNHDPNYLAPLCKDHHIIAHSIDVKYHEARAAVEY